MTQLEIYKAMRKMHNRSAIVVRNGRRMYTVDGVKYACVTSFLSDVIKCNRFLDRELIMTRYREHVRSLGFNLLEQRKWFTPLDTDMPKGMAERSKFIDDLIKIAENEKSIHKR